MRRCTRCVLPETFPDIQFDSEGVCQYCRALPSLQERQKRKAHLRTRLETLADLIRPDPGYHCLVAWGGGRDSTYTLWLLKHYYKLRVLSFTFDNSFISDTALKNIRLIAERLDLDHVTLKPRFELVKQLFTAAIETPMYTLPMLKQSSSLCLARMALTQGMALQLAVELRIPLLVYGWLPGQYPLDSSFHATDAKTLQLSIEEIATPLRKVVGSAIDPYFPKPHELEKARKYPYIAAPLLFMDHDEKSRLHSVQALGWESPTGKNSDSPNCLLDSFAIQQHLQQMGYHPHVAVLAAMVREGYLSREAALSQMEVPAAPEVIRAVKAKLGFPPSYLPAMLQCHSFT